MPGGSIQLAKTTAEKSPLELKQMYLTAVATSEEHNALCDTHIDAVIESLIGGETKSLAALDSVYKKCLLDNGQRAKRLITAITLGRPELAATLNDQLKRNEEFLRKEYPSHLTNEKVGFCGVSYSHAFGEGNENRTDITTELYCDDVMATEVWRQNMIVAIETMNPLPECNRDNVTTLLDYFNNVIITDFHTYTGHVVRKTHEGFVESKIFELLDESSVVVRMDWKMKVLAMSYRESMVEFFGKRGFSHMGVQFTWKKTTMDMLEERLQNKDTTYLSTMHTLFMDLTTDDSKEDGFCCQTSSKK